MSLFDEPGDTFDDEYRAKVLDQFQRDLDELCLGSGRKGKACGVLGWAFCEWCQQDVRTDGRGFWLTAHEPTFEYDADANQVGSVFDEMREGRDIQRERD